MYAVIDLGSNSFHLLIAGFKNQQLQIVGRCSEKIQLAEGLSNSGKLSPQAMERGLRCLQQFKDTLSQHPIQGIKVVGTEAMRRASNAGLFVDQARKLDFDIEIISGEQEARWIFSGVCGPLPNSSNNRLTIDIGGASTEVALGNDTSLQFTASMALGCVSWRDQFFTPRLNFSHNKHAAIQATGSTLAPTISALKAMNWHEVYASSGSAKMLATIGYANNWSQGNITRTCIQETEKVLARAETVDDINIPGLKPERLDLLAPGLVIMSTIMEELGIEEIYYSPTALREGILAEMIQSKVDYKLQGDLFS